MTTPFKEEAVSLADHLDHTAARIGAVNTVCCPGSDIRGANTDSAGVLEALKARRFEVKGRNVLVLGAGGAGRAAVNALTGAGALVTVVNRTRERAARCAADFECLFAGWQEMQKVLKRSDLLINATASPTPPFPLEWLRSGTVVFEADYRNRPLEKMAHSVGCEYLGGEDWLFHQALQAFKLFSGAEPHTRDVLQARGLIKSPAERKKSVVSLIGFMGCGKSTLAPFLAQMLGYSALDADNLLQRSAGMTIERIFQDKGESEFRRLERDLVKKLLTRKRVVIAWGGGVVLSAESRRLLRRHSHVIWLHIPPALIRSRIGNHGRPLLNGSDSMTRIDALFGTRKGLYGATADLVIINDKDSREVSRAVNEEIGPFCGD